eukprot:2444666-Rhodomonas_salina.1
MYTTIPGLNVYHRARAQYRVLGTPVPHIEYHHTLGPYQNTIGYASTGNIIVWGSTCVFSAATASSFIVFSWYKYTQHVSTTPRHRVVQLCSVRQYCAVYAHTRTQLYLVLGCVEGRTVTRAGDTSRLVPGSSGSVPLNRRYEIGDRR